MIGLMKRTEVVRWSGGRTYTSNKLTPAPFEGEEIHPSVLSVFEYGPTTVEEETPAAVLCSSSSLTQYAQPPRYVDTPPWQRPDISPTELQAFKPRRGCSPTRMLLHDTLFFTPTALLAVLVAGLVSGVVEGGRYVAPGVAVVAMMSGGILLIEACP
jgi:hypothetical protein